MAVGRTGQDQVAGLLQQVLPCGTEGVGGFDVQHGSLERGFVGVLGHGRGPTGPTHTEN
jgi:hypothetical protein